MTTKAVKEVVDKVELDVDKAVDKAVELIDVELAEVREGVHTAFTTLGVVNFVNGVAKVSDEIAKELRSIGVIK